MSSSRDVRVAGTHPRINQSYFRFHPKKKTKKRNQKKTKKNSRGEKTSLADLDLDRGVPAKKTNRRFTNPEITQWVGPDF
jgi:hypothetical protein